jgi:hypothetical protein
MRPLPARASTASQSNQCCLGPARKVHTAVQGTQWLPRQLSVAACHSCPSPRSVSRARGPSVTPLGSTSLTWVASSSGVRAGHCWDSSWCHSLGQPGAPCPLCSRLPGSLRSRPKNISRSGRIPRQLLPRQVGGPPVDRWPGHCLAEGSKLTRQPQVEVLSQGVLKAASMEPVASRWSHAVLPSLNLVSKVVSKVDLWKLK